MLQLWKKNRLVSLRKLDSNLFIYNTALSVLEVKIGRLQLPNLQFLSCDCDDAGGHLARRHWAPANISSHKKNSNAIVLSLLNLDLDGKGLDRETQWLLRLLGTVNRRFRVDGAGSAVLPFASVTALFLYVLVEYLDSFLNLLAQGVTVIGAVVCQQSNLGAINKSNSQCVELGIFHFQQHACDFAGESGLEGLYLRVKHFAKDLLLLPRRKAL